jgi:Protein of unknown function (DUF1553)/Protein of unknown function (DUF1549)/Planctomycete cytochrome C
MGLRLGIACTLLVAATPLWPVDFSRDVEPILARRCYVCHGSKQQMNGLRLDDSAAALRGGYSGAVIVPGNSEHSKLVQRVSSDRKDFQMPPGGPPLAAAEIATLRAWIDEGARFPAATNAVAPAKPKSDHWAFQPVRRTPLPKLSGNPPISNPIDAFILARLQSEGIAPSPEASKRTLIRRVTFDLIGLPPTPEEVEQFVNDARPDAYERLVDRLLASPHYGEKWARPWLDLARYADSDGYEKDLVRPHAWRYRHWVIDALNRDLPFDQFTVEQLAGDLLPNAGIEQRVATGFQRNTLTNREAGVDRAEARFEQLVNRANTVGTVWLGLTVGCAQCHDHKYDPISQKEYYQLFAFFDGAEEEDILAPLDGEWEPYQAARPKYEAARRKALEEHGVPELQAKWEARVIEAMDHPGADVEWDFQVTEVRASVDGAERILRTPLAQRSVRQQERITNYFLGHAGPEFGRDKAILARIKEAQAQVRKLDSLLPPISEAQTMVTAPTPAQTHVRLKGDYRALGIAVEPGGLAVLPPMPTGAPPRLALARWLVSKDNPLTARVAVNRAWQELFGRGLVRTSEDFGTQGEKPSHPELLDWLAATFMDDGWSMKRLHKRIVMSATYRQSSAARPELTQRDPDNTLLARQARLRLPAELIRDNALAVSGLLNPVIGGKSVRPPQPEGIAELRYGNSGKWNESAGPDRYRRGLYIHFQRTTPYPQLMTFDAPDSNVACSRRRTSDTPLQSLNLLNDPVFFEAAQALGRRAAKDEAGGFASRLDRLYASCLGRPSSARERERLGRYLDQQTGILENEPESVRKLAGSDRVEDAAWVALSRVLLNLDEFITRE